MVEGKGGRGGEREREAGKERFSSFFLLLCIIAREAAP